MNDFREFQKEYNDYLQHGLPYAEDYICHFGILGMKWGVRRYQNPDGSLTNAGKMRYDHYMKEAQKYRKKGQVYHAKAEKSKYLKRFYNSKALDNSILAATSAEQAEKYGNETPEEMNKRKAQEKEEKLKNNEQKIKYSDSINLENVRKGVVSEEMMDKWTKAAETDTYDLDFLEITQNDYDEMSEDTARKNRLKDYGEYLNAYDAAKKTVNDRDFDGERGDEAADLTLKAYQKMGVDLEDMKPGDQNSRDWAKDSDQTIGAVRVADLCKTVKNKDEVMNILKSLDDNKFLRNIPGSKTALWELDWFYGSEIGGDYAKSHGAPGEKYIDAIFAILQAEGKLNHSAVDEIFEKFGII